MGIVLRKKASDEDLQLIVHWADQHGRHWPTNKDNVPLQKDGKPFKIDNEGNIKPVPEGDTPIRLRFWIKMLTGPESNAITSTILKTRTRRTSRRRGAPVELEQDIDISMSARLKLKAGVKKWEGILGENGKVAPINDEYLDLLPAWLSDSLVDSITALTTIDEEEEGE